MTNREYRRAFPEMPRQEDYTSHEPIVPICDDQSPVIMVEFDVDNDCDRALFYKEHSDFCDSLVGLIPSLIKYNKDIHHYSNMARHHMRFMLSFDSEPPTVQELRDIIMQFMVHFPVKVWYARAIFFVSEQRKAGFLGFTVMDYEENTNTFMLYNEYINRSIDLTARDPRTLHNRMDRLQETQEDICKQIYLNFTEAAKNCPPLIFDNKEILL